LRKLVVKGGLRRIENYLEEYRELIYKYNSMIKDSGYYLKPTHIVVKKDPTGAKRTYVYIGRYWWKIHYAGKKGKTSIVKWIYIGKEKPKELHNMPDPPSSPLLGLSFTILENGDVVLRDDVYKRYSWLFKGLPTEEYSKP